MQMIDGQMVSPRRFVFAAALALVLCTVCVGGVSGANVWDGETKTEPNMVNGVYQISTGAELAYVAAQVNAGNSSYVSASYNLTADIDLNNEPWTPIGKDSDHPFAGTFNGGGEYMIDNLSLTGKHAVLGLFGYVSGTVQNVNINTCKIDPHNNGCTVGSLVGIIKKGGVVKDSAVTKVVANIGNKGGNGDKYTFGGLVGKVLDSDGYEVTNADDVAHYIQGCYVGYAQALYNDGSVADNVKFGLICGGPSFGGIVSGESTHSTCKITVVTTDSGYSTEKTEKLYFEPGTQIVYTIPKGYFFDNMTQPPENNVFNYNNADGSISGELVKGVVYNLTIYQTKITYTVTIPDILTIESVDDTQGKGEGTAEVYASNVALPEGYSIVLSVESENYASGSFYLRHTVSSDFTLPYTLSAEGKALQNGAVFAKFNKTPNGPVTLTASVNSRPQLAGEYQDILTVTVEEVKDTA